MNTKTIKTLILLAVCATLAACDKGSDGKKSDQGTSATKALSETEFTGDPKSAEEMSGHTYRLKTDRQEFVLKNLAQLVWTRVECKAQIATDDRTKDETVTVSFYPSFEIRSKTKDKEKMIVSSVEACGQKLPSQENQVLPVGQLVKDENNKLNLQYGLPDSAAPIVTMIWDETNQVPGELSCNLENGQIAKAVLSECVFVPVEIEQAPQPE